MRGCRFPQTIRAQTAGIAVRHRQTVGVRRTPAIAIDAAMEHMPETVAGRCANLCIELGEVFGFRTAYSRRYAYFGIRGHFKTCPPSNAATNAKITATPMCQNSTMMVASP